MKLIPRYLNKFFQKIIRAILYPVFFDAVKKSVSENLNQLQQRTLLGGGHENPLDLFREIKNDFADFSILD